MRSIYAYHGIRVPSFVIEQPQRITLGMIGGSNIPRPIRLVMIERYGVERFIKEGSRKGLVTKAHVGTDGVLWKFGFDWAAVEVINATAEPDGSHRHYFITVPGTCETARQAVAWSFGVPAREYRIAAAS